MTQTLRNLIKIHRKELDKKRSVIRELEQKKSLLFDSMDRIKHDLSNELKFVEMNDEFHAAYTSFYSRSEQALDFIEMGIYQINRQINDLKDEIYDGFIELKKYEISLKRILQKQKDEESRRINSGFDEISIINYNIMMMNTEDNY